MDISESAKNYIEKMFAGAAVPPLAETDPEFAALFANFAFDEVVKQDDLDDKTRFIAILAARRLSGSGCVQGDAARRAEFRRNGRGSA